MKTPHVCRCCLSDTCFKDISNEYYYAGHKEVYSDILYETFNIKISYQQNGSRLICEDCILQLRNAAAFRKQVLQAEDAINNKIMSICVDIGNQTPKLEEKDDFIDHITGEFDDDEAGYNNHDDEEFDWQNDEILNKDDIGQGELFLIKLEPKEDTEAEESLTTIINNKKSKSNRKHSNSTENNDTDFIETLPEEILKPVKSKTVKSTKGKPHKMESKIRRKIKPSLSEFQIDLKQTSLKLINNSNLCIFESLKTKFRCFYCKETYLQISDLREHSKTHTNQSYLKMCINRLQGMSFKNVDISTLCCKICNEPLKDLIELQKHLTEQHKIDFTSNDHLLIPYHLENGFRCVLCNEEFNTFYRLSVHMHTHYTYNVCEICGTSFINRMSLRLHVHALHKEKKCSMCSATFFTNYSRVKHMRKVHNTNSSKRYCLECNKTFPYTYLLNKHRIREHGLKRQVSNCLECGKTFLTPQNLNIHTRSVHIRERNYPCSYCGMRFFTKCDQKRHERTHEDIRSFSCSYCEGKFKSKDSLRRHLKRQHGHLFISSQINQDQA